VIVAKEGGALDRADDTIDLECGQGDLRIRNSGDDKVEVPMLLGESI
jgi:hypothetical protein